MGSIQDVLAVNLRNYRKAAGLTQEKLAELSGLHRTYIGGIEQRRVNVSIRNIERICDALGVDPAMLLLDARSAADDMAATLDQVLSGQRRRASQLPDCALCTWADDGVRIAPIPAVREDLTIKVLCSLVQAGYTGAALAREYNRVHYQIVDFLDSDDGQPPIRPPATDEV